MIKKIAIILSLTITILASIVFIIWQNKIFISDLYAFTKDITLYEIEKEVIKDDMNQIDYQHISIFYDTSSESLIPTTEVAIDDAIEMNKELLNNSFDIPLDLIFINDNQLMEQFSGSEYGVGVYLNTLTSEYICILPQYIDNVFDRQVIMHEYTHYVFEHSVAELGLNSTDDFPLWFNEGIADYVGYSGEKVVFNEFQVIPFDELKSREQWDALSSNMNTNVYGQSYLAIYYLIDEYGNDVIIDIMNSTESTGSFESGLEEVTDLKIDELDEFISE